MNIIRSLFAIAVALTVGASLTLFAESTTPTPTATASTSISPAGSPPVTSSKSNFDERMGEFEAKMDSIFADTFHNIGNWFEKSKFVSSVDLREQKDKYVVRVYLRNFDTSKVNAKIDNNGLRITVENNASSEGATETQRYEQIIGLLGAVQADKMRIDRKPNLVVVTLPKTEALIASSTRSPTASPSPGLANGDQSIINEMERMQGRMDQILRNAFPNDLTGDINNLRLGSAVNVDEQKDKYVVHFYLPDRNLSDVNVKFENGRLDLIAKEENSATNKTANANAQTYRAGQYEQIITLTGPMTDKAMKVDAKGNTIVVTIPKA